MLACEESRSLGSEPGEAGQVFRKALPALPFSIFFGIFAFILTKMSIMPFLTALNSQQLVF